MQVIKNDPSILIDNALLTSASDLTLNEQRLLLAAILNVFSVGKEHYANEDGDIDLLALSNENIRIQSEELARFCWLADAVDQGSIEKNSLAWQNAKEAATALLRRSIDAGDNINGLYNRNIIFDAGSKDFKRALTNKNVHLTSNLLDDKVVKSPSKKGCKKSRWLSDYDSHNNAGYIDVKFTVTALSMLINLTKQGNFTSFKIRAALSLGNVNAIKLFMLISRYRDYRNVNEYTTSMDELYFALSIPESFKFGTGPSGAKRAYIEPAIKEINDKFDLGLSVHYSKSPGSRKEDIFTFAWDQEKLKKLSYVKVVPTGDVEVDNLNRNLAIAESTAAKARKSIVDAKLTGDKYVESRVTDIVDELQPASMSSFS